MSLRVARYLVVGVLVATMLAAGGLASAGDGAGLTSGVAVDEQSTVRAAQRVRYVAMGDSFQAGHGAGWYQSNTTVEDKNDCYRSWNAYAYDIAISQNLVVEFVACSGAEIPDILSRTQEPGDASAGIPKQEPQWKYLDAYLQQSPTGGEVGGIAKSCGWGLGGVP